MKTTELRKKDVAGLQTEIKELQRAHFGLRMQKATQQNFQHRYAAHCAPRHCPRQDYSCREAKR